MRQLRNPLIWGGSDTGLVRPTNEDRVFPNGDWRIPFGWSPWLFASRGWLMAVADGVSRSGRGAAASELAIAVLVAEYYGGTAATGHADVRLMQAAHAANQAVSMIADNLEGRRATTTLVAAVIDHDQAWVVHAGDSRAYLVRDRRTEAELLTHDHTVAQELLDQGTITLEEALVHPDQSLLTRVLGAQDDLVFDLCGPLNLGSRDRLLLCSDGLSSAMTSSEIAEVVAQYSPQEAAIRLVEMANERGGYDNVSVVVAETPTLIRLVRWQRLLRLRIEGLRNRITAPKPHKRQRPIVDKCEAICMAS